MNRLKDSRMNYSNTVSVKSFKFKTEIGYPGLNFKDKNNTTLRRYFILSFLDGRVSSNNKESNSIMINILVYNLKTFIIS